MVAKTGLKSGQASRKRTGEGVGAVVEGRVEKPKRPVSKKVKDANKAARLALATGKIASEEQDRKLQMDLRTLYVRFKVEAPADEGAVRRMVHPDIKFVRIPRQTQKRIRYAFVEFGSEGQCEDARAQIGQNAELADRVYVDFVGVKSKGGGKPREERGRRGKPPINPTRLFVSGLVEGMTEDKLHQLFPKSQSASIPKGSKRKGSSYGFVQFANPADAKAAFEASQKLIVSRKEGGGHHLTVIYAKRSKKVKKEAEVKVEEEGKSEEVVGEGDGDVESEGDGGSSEEDVENDEESEEEDGGEEANPDDAEDGEEE